MSGPVHHTMRAGPEAREIAAVPEPAPGRSAQRPVRARLTHAVRRRGVATV